MQKPICPIYYEIWRDEIDTKITLVYLARIDFFAGVNSQICLCGVEISIAWTIPKKRDTRAILRPRKMHDRAIVTDN